MRQVQKCFILAFSKLLTRYAQHMRPLYIAVVTPNFALAGVPVAQFRFANLLASRGHAVDLIVGTILCTPLPALVEGVRLIHLRKTKVRSMLVPLTTLLMRSKYDLVFSAEDHLTIIMAVAKHISRFSGRLICSSRVTPYDVFIGPMFSMAWCLRICYRWAMGRVDLLTCVSRQMVTQYRALFGATKHVGIYNPVVTESLLTLAESEPSHKWLGPSRDYKVIMTIGRLSAWKGHADLINAFASVRRQLNAKLIIIGDGELRESLQSLAGDLGIERDVDFMGYVSNPLPFLKRTDIFVLSSLVEGMPNVLVEAMALGRQVVSTDCDTGPREIIQTGVNGHLVAVGSPAEMAESIISIAQRPFDAELVKRAVSDFWEGAVLENYSRALNIEL